MLTLPSPTALAHLTGQAVVEAIERLRPHSTAAADLQIGGQEWRVYTYNVQAKGPAFFHMWTVEQQQIPLPGGQTQTIPVVVHIHGPMNACIGEMRAERT